jgi:hypothetical protein
MSSVVGLEQVELLPVLELEPWTFATQEHPSPPGHGPEFAEQWQHFWADSLADSGLKGLRPIRPSSWLVPLSEFADTGLLRSLLEALFREWGPM